MGVFFSFSSPLQTYRQFIFLEKYEFCLHVEIQIKSTETTRSAGLLHLGFLQAQVGLDCSHFILVSTSGYGAVSSELEGLEPFPRVPEVALTPSSQFGQQQPHCCHGILIPHPRVSYRKENANSVDVNVAMLGSCQAGPPNTQALGRHLAKASQYCSLLTS